MHVLRVHKKKTQDFILGDMLRENTYTNKKKDMPKECSTWFLLSGVFPLFSVTSFYMSECFKDIRWHWFFLLWKRIENKKRQRIFKSSFWNIKETGWVYFITHNNLTTNMGQNIKGQGLKSNNSNNHIILLPGKNL